MFNFAVVAFVSQAFVFLALQNIRIVQVNR